jgi:hypothetical protein
MFRSPTPAEPVPLSVAMWVKDPHKVAALRELIQAPVFREACALLLNASLPSFSSVAAQDVEYRAARQAWLAGYSDFHSDLQRLTDPASVGTKDLPGEWTHLAPELKDN